VHILWPVIPFTWHFFRIINNTMNAPLTHLLPNLLLPISVRYMPPLPRTKLQSLTKLLRHFGTNENFDLENYLPGQICLPPPPYQCCFATKIPLMKPQSFQTTLNEGKGEGKPFCNIVGVSIQGNWEIYTLIAFVSTSFVQDCRV